MPARGWIANLGRGVLLAATWACLGDTAQALDNSPWCRSIGIGHGPGYHAYECCPGYGKWAHPVYGDPCARPRYPGAYGCGPQCGQCGQCGPSANMSYGVATGYPGTYVPVAAPYMVAPQVVPMIPLTPAIQQPTPAGPPPGGAPEEVTPEVLKEGEVLLRIEQPALVRVQPPRQPAVKRRSPYAATPAPRTYAGYSIGYGATNSPPAKNPLVVAGQSLVARMRQPAQEQPLYYSGFGVPLARRTDSAAQRPPVDSFDSHEAEAPVLAEDQELEPIVDDSAPPKLVPTDLVEAVPVSRRIAQAPAAP